MPTIVLEDGTTFGCDHDDTILRAALRAGLGFPYACNVGSCGNCRFTLEGGSVQHLRADAPAWSDRDRHRGRRLGCQAVPLDDCRIKVRLDPEAASTHRPVRMRGRLTNVVEITHDISEFCFALDGPDDFVPGQYALIEPPGVEGARAYSMCNLPGGGTWCFQIKRVPDGAATGVLFDALAAGDDVSIDGPYGVAYLREDGGRDLLLVAGGSGLSPMISIARAAASGPSFPDREILFFYGGRSPRDICGEEMLAELPGYGELIHYVPAVSEDSDGWSGATGYVHDVVAGALGARLLEMEVYFAGPSAMAQAMQAMLNETGVSPEHMHFDEFY